jgi:hypothetical protein
MVQSESIPFVPGLELSRALYEATAPILARHFPDLAYGAGRCAKSIAPQGSVSRSAPPGGWCSALYQSAGFLQVGRSTLGGYSLLWFELLFRRSALKDSRA